MFFHLAVSHHGQVDLVTQKNYWDASRALDPNSTKLLEQQNTVTPWVGTREKLVPHRQGLTSAWDARNKQPRAWQ